MLQKVPVSHLWILMKFSLLNADLISLLERRSDTCKSDEEDSGGSDSDQSTSSKGNVYNQELL